MCKCERIKFEEKCFEGILETPVSLATNYGESNVMVRWNSKESGSKVMFMNRKEVNQVKQSVSTLANNELDIVIEENREFRIARLKDAIIFGNHKRGYALFTDTDKFITAINNGGVVEFKEEIK